MMKLITLIGIVLSLGISMPAQTFDSGSTGADGPFNPPSQAPQGTQVLGDCTRAPGCTAIVPLREPPNHVFNFTTVTIGQFITVKFRRNAANTPTFILAQGDVVINGTIDVSGQNGVRGMLAAAPGGPGGFGGGVAGAPGSPTRVGGAGSGPGGGSGGGSVSISEPNQPAAGGGFGSPGRTYRPYIEPGTVYGILELIPLIGGSGGGGGATVGAPSGNGGGGGGTLLIASSRVIDLGSGGSNAIIANGGNGEFGGSVYDGTPGGGGSGGALRLVAPTLRGSRAISALGGQGGWDENAGGVGRIRFETFALQYTGIATPQYTLGLPGPVFPPITPKVRIVSIGGVSVPGQPTSDISTPDVTVPATISNPVRIELEATNVPSGTRARVIAAPQIGSGPRVITQPVELTGAPGQPKRGTVTVTLPTRGVGIISVVIDTVVPEP